VRSPFRVEGVAKAADAPAPQLGESGESVLREAGFKPDHIRDLMARNIVAGGTGSG
jgi:crotonobetainyl-CoA:carnitine CoA-transferase CaiB-like acyl-CoA transferase